MELQFTRRDFFKGSIVLALGAAGAGVLSSCASGNAAAQSSGESSAAAAATDAAKTVTLHRGYGAAHGDKCYTSIVVATADDGTILGASVDDYQFTAVDSGMKGVANADAGLAEGFAEGQMLMSKVQNNEAYSKLIAEKAQSTQTWVTSMTAIQDFAVGKKASDLKSVGLDAVSGATLVDTPNYLKAIAQVAEDGTIITTGSYTGDGSDLKLGRVNAAAHGEKAFAEAVSLVQGDVLTAASIDEFQFLDATTTGLVPVPNSDAAFGENYAEGVALVSKSVNSDIYSAMMKEKAQATTPWLDSMTAIEAFIAGQKISDVKANGPDAVSGATLVDTAGYVQAAATAAKAI